MMWLIESTAWFMIYESFDKLLIKSVNGEIVPIPYM